QAKADFEAAHKAQFGFVYDDKPMIVETVSVEGSDGREQGRTEPESKCEKKNATPSETRKLFTEGAWHDAGVSFRDSLKPGYRISGPALIVESHQTIVVE